MNDDRKDENRMKKIMFSLIAVFLGILIIEMFSFAALSLAKGKWFSRSYTLTDLRLVIESSGQIEPGFATKPTFMRRDILHPYIGYVLDDPPDEDQYGFSNNVSSIQKKGSGKIIIAITGGSFAYQTYDAAIDVLIEELKTNDIFKNKEFVAIRLAAGGYKQPQQLMILNYLLSLGGEFDILINIDGFNEAALPLTENVPYNVFAFFPRKWLLRVDLMSDEKVFQYVFEGMKIRRQRLTAAKIFETIVLRNSYTLNFVWESIDHLLQAKINEINGKAQGLLTSAQSYVASGPSQIYESDEELFKEIADVWKRSSLQMANLSIANKIKYFHFLQPNQYFAGSKPLTDFEKEEAFDSSHIYRKPVEDVYPYLITAGREIEQENVYYKDLSMIFAANSETLYADTCCHLNEKGYEIIAKEVARYILAEQKKVN